MGVPRLASSAERGSARWTAAGILRVAVTLLAILIGEFAVCAAAALVPAAMLYELFTRVTSPWLRIIAVAAAAAPAYLLFALCLMPLSAASVRLTGARTPPASVMRIADMGWPLMQWARYMAASHLVRVCAGSLFKGTPLWTVYLRMNGARLGRRVFVNSLSVSDHNLLEFGHDVVIGDAVHLSGHTVERGLVITGTVRLAEGVTVGLGSVVEVDVEVGAHTQIGALSFVPKHARLAADRVYVGIPVKPL